MNVRCTENPEPLCLESMPYLGIFLPIYLFIQQVCPDCLRCARPCAKSRGDTDMVSIFEDHIVQSVMDMNGGKTVASNPAHQKSRLCAEEVPQRTRSLLSVEILEGLVVFRGSHLTFDPWQPTFPGLPQLLLALPIYA